MLGNILFIGFVIFSLFQFFAGISLGIQNPILFVVSILSIALLYLLMNLNKGRIISGISINKHSIINKIKKNEIAKIIIASLLLILSVGNFNYANNWIGTSISKGIEYLEAVILSLISFVILSKKVK